MKRKRTLSIAVIAHNVPSTYDGASQSVGHTDVYKCLRIFSTLSWLVIKSNKFVEQATYLKKKADKISPAIEQF